MAKGEFVDIDIYGRGFDGVFGSGAEAENMRQAVMKFQAMKRFQERVKPGEYIDLDLYGRGDPRIFGPGAHIETHKNAESHLREAQQSKTTRKFNLRAVVFPSGIKAIAKKARAVIRRISSKTDESESDIEAPVDNIEEDNAVAQVTLSENQVEGECISDEESPDVDDPSINAETIHATTDRKETSDEDKGPKEDSIADPTSKTEKKPESADDSATASEDIDRAPRRFKSRLPSEEVRPQVEKGYVARTMKSFSSFDRSDEQMKFTGNAVTGELSRLAAFSSYPLGGISQPEASESSSSKELDKEDPPNNGRPGLVSMSEEVANRVPDGSDEELQLSFSSSRQILVTHQSTGNVSTSSDEGLVTTNSQHDRIVHDEAGRSVVGGNKITELFRSGDSDSDSDMDGIDNSRVPGGLDKAPEKSSLTDDENFSENIAPQLREEYSTAVSQQGGDEEPDSVMDSRGTSIIQVVETPRLTSQELIEDALLIRGKDEEREMEATLGSSSVVETTQLAINETTEYSAAEIIDDIEETPDRAVNETTEYSAAEIVEGIEETPDRRYETTEYSAADIVDDIEDPAINETTEYSAAEIVDATEETLHPAITEMTEHSAAEIFDGITVCEDLASTDMTERKAVVIVDKGTSSRNTDSSTADYEDQDSVEAAGNEQGSESIKDSDHSEDANSSSEVMTSSLEEDSDDVEATEVDSSEIEETEEGENIVEVENVEEVEDIAVLAVDSVQANLTSQDDTEDAGNTEDPDKEEDGSGNDADGANQDQGNNNKTFWQRLGLFNIVMTNSWVIY